MGDTKHTPATTDTWLVNGPTIYQVGDNGYNRCWATLQSASVALSTGALAAMARSAAVALNAHGLLLAYAECQEAWERYEYQDPPGFKLDDAEEVCRQHGWDEHKEPSVTAFLDSLRRAALAAARGTEPQE